MSAPFRFDNTFARELPGLYSACLPALATSPRLLFFNEALALELGLDPQALAGKAGAALFSGNRLPEGAEPLAQVYAGHQFGHFSPRLGDGRALLLGEVVDQAGHRRDIALKGSGRTPFSRGGDGKAAVAPMLREALLGEAMHALGIASTRALAVVATGELVQREQALPGAVLTRVAQSHLRVGTFEYFASQGDRARLAQLAAYTIARHDPALVDRPDRHVALLRAVVARQASLVAQWVNVGFIHGVMNTDNMALSGETIDYGPCAFLEAYDPGTVFSSNDHAGRYAYGNQKAIALWNLARFAEALMPLMLASDDDEAGTAQAVASLTEVLDGFNALYETALLQGQRAKLGLALRGDDSEVRALIADWLTLLKAHRVDFTLAWRRLAEVAAGDPGSLQGLFAEPSVLEPWLERWLGLCAASGESPLERAAAMRRVSPLIIPRNHRVEEALEAAQNSGDLAPFEQLLKALRRPFDELPEHARYAEPAPVGVTTRYKTFCGT